MIIRFIYIILLICLTSCFQLDKIEKYNVTIDFKVDSVIKSSTLSTLYLQKTNKAVVYHYSDSSDYKDHYLCKIIRYNDEALYLDDVACKKEEEKSFKLGEDNVVVEKFFYDIPEVEDEEFVFFFNNEYGIFLKYSYQWRTTVAYYKENDVMKALIEEIIPLAERSE